MEEMIVEGELEQQAEAGAEAEAALELLVGEEEQPSESE